MTHKIKVQMFGNFRMDYNGAPFVAEKMHKESQFNRMMQALIHYSDCGVAKDKLEEIVIGERDIDAPHTALRVIVYKTKQKLAQLGLPGKNLVYLEGGIYYWTPDIEIEEDAAEFEKLYNEACALEKQMPHEPESAETVCDERIKEIEDNMLELYIKALYLYKGEFLAAYTGETWIAQEARRYHIMFEKIINEAAYILRKRKQFKGLEKLGVYAAKVDPFNEWEELIMEAMVETRRYDEAEELYTDVVDYYLRECGIYPSSRLLEILEKYSNQMNHAHEILENIQEGMNEQEETERGGYFCSYPVFRGIYQASIRIMKRTRVPVYLMLCTLEDEEGRQVQSETKMNKYSRQLKKCVGESIRYSDIYEDESSLYMNYEYYYWFKYSEAIDYFVVGTDEHKRSLEAFLKEYDCFVPHIAAIPPGAIPEGKLKSKNNRWRGSIISASRLSPRKGIDILIKSVIKAHEINQTINLDIYGSGNDEYTSYLQNIVKDAGADDYIHFKGRCNLEKIYPHYELFASFSLWETFGLSLMEAVGDGLAMVGLDVRYGNRLFIHPDENGYLVDFDIETDYQNKDKLCERTAAAIVKIFEDDDRLKKFHENSYMIAEEYKEHVIESKWMQLIKNIP